MINLQTVNVPQGEVDALIPEVADGAGLELGVEMPAVQTGQLDTSSKVSVADSDENCEVKQHLKRGTNMLIFNFKDKNGSVQKNLIFSKKL